MKRATSRYVYLAFLAALTAVSCDTPLTAPVASTISVFSSTKALGPGGSADIAAIVIEEAGTPVHNGTVVRFSATLGTVDPVQAETRDGVAYTTFTAGSATGTAVVTATSGAAVSGENQPNVVEIVIGS